MTHNVLSKSLSKKHFLVDSFTMYKVHRTTIFLSLITQPQSDEAETIDYSDFEVILLILLTDEGCYFHTRLEIEK